MRCRRLSRALKNLLYLLLVILGIVILQANAFAFEGTFENLKSLKGAVEGTNCNRARDIAVAKAKAACGGKEPQIGKEDECDVAQGFVISASKKIYFSCPSSPNQIKAGFSQENAASVQWIRTRASEPARGSHAIQ